MANAVQQLEQGRDAYHKKDKTNKRYFKCSNKNTSQCKGTAKLLKGQKELIAIEPHSPWCEDDGEDELIAIRQWMVEQQTNQYWEFKPLWEAACKLFPNAAVMTSLHSVYSSLSRTRLGIFPKVARNFEQFCRQIENHEFDVILNYNGEFEVSADVIEDEEENKHVAVCDKQLIKDHFGSTKKALFDGTFFSRINLSECKQLFCINVVYKAKIIIVYYCFMTSLTGPAYKAVFTHFKSIDPFVELEIGMFDFELGMRLGFRQVFPNVRITSCNVHYDRAVLAKYNKLPVEARNHPGFGEAVLDLLALAFLPPNKIQDEFDRQCAVMEPQLRAHMSPILDTYFPNYWLKVITPRGFSVYGLDTRTNNGSESNNHTLHTDLGKRPQTCIAMFRLLLMFVRIRRMIEQSRNLEQIRCLPSYRTMLVEKKLFKVWRELERPPVNLSVPEFIKAVGRLKGKRGGDVNKGIARIAEEYVDAEFAQLRTTPTDLIDPDHEVDAAMAQSAAALQNPQTPISAAAEPANTTGRNTAEQDGALVINQETDSTPTSLIGSSALCTNDGSVNLHGTQSGDSDDDFSLYLESSSNNSSHYNKTGVYDSIPPCATEITTVLAKDNDRNVIPETSESEDEEVMIERVDQRNKRPASISLESRFNDPCEFNSEEDAFSPSDMFQATSTPVCHGKTRFPRHRLRQKVVTDVMARDQNFSPAPIEQGSESVGVNKNEGVKEGE
ncbi:hypothetical protein QAD02_020119 [Eretmocerus hayati]|uniref:Uncharacterized protein n=1 Tax=Eretmocerus hayati TaxID=131215 RepID=A0ACC2PPQ4_9HYME|nr:hypothetical protein QAD02_020119 [Eretmocerus hayati]